MPPTREQVRAARALIGISGDDLAKRAGIGVATLYRYERGGEIGDLVLDAIRRALEDAGILFIDDTTDFDAQTVGVGVALKRRAKARRVKK